MGSQGINLTRGYTFAVASAAILSTTAILIRHLTQTYHLPPLLLSFWRDSFVFLTLLPILRWFWPRLLRLDARCIPYLIAYGVVLALFNSLWTFSVALNGAAIATVLVYCSAAFTALLGWWFLQEGLGWVKVLAVGFGLAGAGLVSGGLGLGGWRTNPAGILTGLFSGLCYAVYSLMGRSASQRGLNPWTTVVYTFGFAGIFLLFLNLLPGGFLPGTAIRPSDLLWLDGAWTGWGLLFLLAAGPTVLGFGLYNTSLTYLPSSVANLIVTLEPVFTAVIAYFLLGERLSALQIAGGLMIVSGVIILRVYDGWSADYPARERTGRLGLAIGQNDSEKRWIIF